MEQKVILRRDCDKKSKEEGRDRRSQNRTPLLKGRWSLVGAPMAKSQSHSQEFLTLTGEMLAEDR